MKKLFIFFLLLTFQVLAQKNPYGFTGNESSCFVPADGVTVPVRDIKFYMTWYGTTFTTPDLNDWHVLELRKMDGSWTYTDSVYVKNTTNPSGCKTGYILQILLEDNTWYQWRIVAKRTGYDNSYTRWNTFKTLEVFAPSSPTLSINLLNKDKLSLIATHGGSGNYYSINNKYSGEDPRYPVDAYTFEIVEVLTNTVVYTSEKFDKTTFSVNAAGMKYQLSTILSSLNLKYSTQYKIKAISYNQYGNASSSWVTFTTPQAPVVADVLTLPSSPTLISPANISIGLQVPIEFKWRRVPETVQYYTILIKNNGNIVYQKYSDGATDTTYILTEKLLEGQIYTWTVYGTNEIGKGIPSQEYMLRTKTSIVIPEPVVNSYTPTLLSPINNGTNISLSPNLTQKNTTDPVNSYLYEVYKGTTLIWSKSYNSSFTSIKLPITLDYYTQYKWRIKATNAGGEGISGWFYFTTLPEPTQPDTTTLGSVSLITPTDNLFDMLVPFTFMWNKTTNATSYDFEVADALTGEKIISYTSSAKDTSYRVSIPPLKNDNGYYWKVRAKNSLEVSTWKVRYFKTIAPVPEPIGILLPPTPQPPARVNLLYPKADTTNFSLPCTFRWSKSPGATYYIFECYSSDNTRLLYLSGTDTTYSPGSGLSTGLHRWRVQACNTTGASKWSQRWFQVNSIPVVKPSVPAPPVIIPSVNDTLKADLTQTFTWHQVEQATNYGLTITEGNGNELLNVTGLKDTTYTLPNTFVNDATYSWKVTATNDAGTSTYSDREKFTTKPDEDIRIGEVGADTLGEIILNAGFETGLDNFRQHITTQTRVGITYGIHPAGNYMLALHQWNETGYTTCATPLNLVAGNTYHFTLKFNNISADLPDTVKICADTLSKNNTLAGTTGIVIPVQPKGVSDLNWRVITFEQTPSVNGGFFVVVSTRNTEFFIDSIVVRKKKEAIPAQTLSIITPDSITLANRFQDINVKWTTNTRSRAGIFLDDSLLTVISPGDTTWTWVKENIQSYNPVNDHFLRVKAIKRNKIISIADTTKPTGTTETTYSGIGSQEDPYIVYTASQFIQLFTDKSGQQIDYLELGNNLDFSGLDPLSSRYILNNHIKSFDGKGFTISNISYLRDATHPLEPYTDLNYREWAYDNGKLKGIVTLSNPKDYYSIVNLQYKVALFQFVENIKNVNFENCHIRIDNPTYPFSIIQNVIIEGKYSGKAVPVFYDQGDIEVSLISNKTEAHADNSIEKNYDNISFNNCSIYLDVRSWEQKIRTQRNLIKVSLVTTGVYKVSAFTTSELNNIRANNINITVFSGKQENNGQTLVGSLAIAEASANTIVRAKDCYLLNTNITLNALNYKQNVIRTIGSYQIEDVYFQGKLESNGTNIIHLFSYNGRTYDELDYADSLNKYADRGNIEPRNKNAIINASIKYSGDLTLATTARTLGSSANGAELRKMIIEDSQASFFNIDSINGIKTFTYDGITTSKLKSYSFLKSKGFNFEGNSWRLNGKNNGFPNKELDTLYSYEDSVAVEDSVILSFPTADKEATINIIPKELNNITFKNDTSHVDICINFRSSGVDSALVYKRYDNNDWEFIKKVYVKRLGSLEDTTQVCFELYPERKFGALSLRIVEDKDTAITNLKLVNLGDIRLINLVGGSIFWGSESSPNGKGFIWAGLQDITSGWVASYHSRRENYTSILLDKTSKIYPDTIGWTLSIKRSNGTIENIDNLRLYDYTWASRHGGISLGGRRIEINHNRRIYTYEYDRTTKRGKILMYDPKHNIEYEVYSFSGEDAQRRKFTPESMVFSTTTDDNGIMLINASSSLIGFNVPGKTSVQYLYLNTAEPWAMVFPGLPAPVSNALASDEFAFTTGETIDGQDQPTRIRFLSDRFRGIHPKIWKYGNINGVKP